jgi:hypothetical protein
MRLPHIAWVLVAAVGASGCHTLAPLTLDEIGHLRPSRVWVTDHDQSIVEVSGPMVFNDTIVGYINGEFQELPANSVSKVMMRRPARARTIALAAAGTAGLAAFVWMIAGGEQYVNPAQFVDCDDDPLLPECQGQAP